MKRGVIILILALLSTMVSAQTIHYLDLSQPATLSVEPKHDLRFTFKGEEYSLKVTDILQYSVVMELSTKLNELLIHEGETLEVNLDEFGPSDLSIHVDTLVPGRRAMITIQLIGSPEPVPIVQAPPPTPVVVEAPVEEKPAEQPAPVTEEVPVVEQPAQQTDYTRLFMILGAIVLVIGAIWGSMYVMLLPYAKAGVSPKLVSFVDKAMRSQMPTDEMRSKLKEAGWTESEILLATKHVQAKNI